MKWILSTHEHFDHGGGIAALMKVTGAQLAVGPRAAAALREQSRFPMIRSLSCWPRIRWHRRASIACWPMARR